MPRTPDRFPGDRSETATLYADTNPTLPTQDGEQRFSSGRFRYQDDIGVFESRDVVVEHQLPGDTTVHSGTTRLARLLVVPDGTALTIEDDGELLVL